MIGLYKTELIKPRGPWRTAEQVEIAATSDYVDWSTAGGSTKPAATFRPQNSRPPTTVTTKALPRPASHKTESPDSPGAAH